MCVCVIVKRDHKEGVSDKRGGKNRVRVCVCVFSRSDAFSTKLCSLNDSI